MSFSISAPKPTSKQSKTQKNKIALMIKRRLKKINVKLANLGHIDL